MFSEVPRLHGTPFPGFSDLTTERTHGSLTVVSYCLRPWDFWSLEFLPSEDPCPSRGRDALAVPPDSTAARAHPEDSRETFKHPRTDNSTSPRRHQPENLSPSHTRPGANPEGSPPQHPNQTLPDQPTMPAIRTEQPTSTFCSPRKFDTLWKTRRPYLL